MTMVENEIRLADRPQWWALILVFACAGLSGPGRAWGQPRSFQASGNIRFSQQGLNDGRTNRYEFQFSFDRCKWTAVVRPIDGGGRATEYGYDGSRVWAVIGSVNGQPQDGEAVVASSAPGPAPFEAPYHIVPVLWAALGQSCHLDSLEPIRELAAPSMDSPDRRFPALLERAASGLRLPTHIVYRDSGIDPVRKVRRTPPFDQGYVTAEYQVLDRLSDPHLGDLPSQFQYLVFSPRYDGSNSNDLHRLKTYVGAVTNYQTSGGVLKSVLPRLPQGQGVDMYDVRFGNYAKPISYFMTNHWLNDDALRMTADFQKWIEGSPQYSAMMPRRRRGYLLVLTLITLAFLGAYSASRHREKQKKEG